MAVVVNDSRNPNTSENAVLGCLATALCSVALIYSFADVSGAHFNPAVTFATMITGKTAVKKGLSYIAIQMFASVIATFALMVVYPDVPNGTTRDIPAFVAVKPSANLVNAFFMELILVFIV